MKFVVWGLGMYGRRTRAFLGKRVLAYIDSKESFHGTIEDDLPVVSFEEYLASGVWNTPDTWIVVTPRHFTRDIIAELRRKNFKRYFVLTDAVPQFYIHSLQDIIDLVLRKNISKDSSISMDGLDCFHAVLYDELLSAGQHPVIWIPEQDWEKAAEQCKLLSEWDIRCGDAPDRERISDTDLLGATRNIYANPMLEKFHDMYAGRRCFIVATGPSLRMEDLETLRKHKELCISMNGIFHAFPRVKWRPDFVVMIDKLLARWTDIIDHMDDVPYKLIADPDMHFWKNKHPDSVYRIHCMGGDIETIENSFSEDIVQGVYGNGTVTNACIQIAIYLGCKEIYLIGVDFYQLIEGKGLGKHFVDDYNQGVEDDDVNPCFTESLVRKLMWKGYRVSREYADTHPPLKIYNATRGGHLEVFERVDFDSLF